MADLKSRRQNNIGALNVAMKNWDLTLFQPNQLQLGVNSGCVFHKRGAVFVFVLKRAFRSAELELPNLSLTRRFVWGQRRLVQRD